MTQPPERPGRSAALPIAALPFALPVLLFVWALNSRA
jgi:hypothetical protein